MMFYGRFYGHSKPKKYLRLEKNITPLLIVFNISKLKLFYTTFGSFGDENFFKY